MHLRHSRRTLRIAIGALLLATPALASCGFDYATDRINSHTAGTNEYEGSVDVLNALVVAEHPNSGTLVGLLANNDDDREHTLTAVTGPEDAPAEIDELEVQPGGSAQLADAGIRIEGTFEAGAFIALTLTFDDSEEVAVEVPVVTACGPYEGLDDAPSTKGRGSQGSDAEAYSCEAEEAPEH